MAPPPQAQAQGCYPVHDLRAVDPVGMHRKHPVQHVHSTCTKFPVAQSGHRADTVASITVTLKGVAQPAELLSARAWCMAFGMT